MTTWGAGGRQGTDGELQTTTLSRSRNLGKFFSVRPRVKTFPVYAVEVGRRCRRKAHYSYAFIDGKNDSGLRLQDRLISVSVHVMSRKSTG